MDSWQLIGLLLLAGIMWFWIWARLNRLEDQIIYFCDQLKRIADAMERREK